MPTAKAQRALTAYHATNGGAFLDCRGALRLAVTRFYKATGQQASRLGLALFTYATGQQASRLGLALFTYATGQQASRQTPNPRHCERSEAIQPHAHSQGTAL